LLLKGHRSLASVFVKLIALKYGENWRWHLARNRAIIAAGVFVVASYQRYFERRSPAFSGVCKLIPLTRSV
jgi:hypothetical protein